MMLSPVTLLGEHGYAGVYIGVVWPPQAWTVFANIMVMTHAMIICTERSFKVHVSTKKTY
jgi:hypothetical protein